MDGLNLSTASDVYVGNQLARYVYIGSTKVWDYKTTPVYTAPTAKSGLVYSGSAQSLLNAGSTSHGTIYYSSNNTDWSTTIPSSTNASTSITVYWKLVGDGRHYDVASTAITCSIAKANQNAPTATGASVSYGNTATATASGGGGQGSIEWSNGNTLSGNVGSKKTKARWSGNSNYNASAWSNEVTLAITKINPTITAPTAKANLTYSGSSQTLYNAGSNTTAGSFNYTNGTRTDAGSQTVSWTFTPTDTTNYNSMNGSFTGSIAQATGSATVSGRSVTYSRGAQNMVSVSGNTGTMHYRVGTGGSWTTTIPTRTTVGSDTIYYYMDASTNYTARGSQSSPWGNVTGSVTKATPVLSTAPTKTADWTYNGSSKSLASGGAMKHSSSDTTAVAGTFTYATAQNAGTYTATWNFTPTDTTNYNSTSGNVGTVTVAQANGSTGVTALTVTYNRGAQSLISVSGNTGTNHYRLGTSGSWGTSIPTATTAGTYTVYVYTDASTNYKAVGSSSSPSSYTCTISKATPVLSTSPTYRTGLSYTGSAQNLLTGGAMKHSASDTTAVAGTFTYDQGTNAGTYTNKKWYFAPTDTTNYNSTNGTVTGSASIAKVNAHTAPVANNTTYSGSAIALLKNGSANNKGTLEYSSNNSTWSTTVPTQTTAGTYTTYWRFTPTDTTNYNTISSTSISTTISKANRTIAFTSAPTSVVVGSTIAVAASPSAGSGDGTITYSSSNTSKATVSGSTVTGVASGTVTITATISTGTNYNSASISYALTVNDPTLTLSTDSVSLDATGTAQTVTVTSNTSWGIV